MMSTVERLLTPAEVAELFRVDPKTVTRWAAAGRLPVVRTPGGRYRFDPAQIAELLAEHHEDAHSSEETL